MPRDPPVGRAVHQGLQQLSGFGRAGLLQHLQRPHVALLLRRQCPRLVPKFQQPLHSDLDLQRRRCGQRCPQRRLRPRAEHFQLVRRRLTSREIVGVQVGKELLELVPVRAFRVPLEAVLQERDRTGRVGAQHAERRVCLAALGTREVGP